MRNRTFVRYAAAGIVIAALVLAGGCTSGTASGGDATATPAGAFINPLVPANTARDTVNKANDAAAKTQKQLDGATAP